MHPTWVINGNTKKSAPYRLCPQKRTCVSALSMSALCHKRTSVFCPESEQVPQGSHSKSQGKLRRAEYRASFSSIEHRAVFKALRQPGSARTSQGQILVM